MSPVGFARTGEAAAEAVCLRLTKTSRASSGERGEHTHRATQDSLEAFRGSLRLNLRNRSLEMDRLKKRSPFETYQSKGYHKRARKEERLIYAIIVQILFRLVV